MTAVLIPFPGTKPVELPPPAPTYKLARVPCMVVANPDGFMELLFTDEHMVEELGIDGILVENTSEVLEQIVRLCDYGNDPDPEDA